MGCRSASWACVALAFAVVATPLAAQIVFEPATSEGSYSSQPNLITTGDLDGDGDLDVVAGNAFGFDVLLNPGDGDLGAPSLTFAGSPVHEPVLFDADEDGILDLATAGSALWLRIGNGDGSFGPEAMLNATDDATIFNACAAELTGDAHLDLVSLNRGTVAGGNQLVQLLPGNGDGTFGEAQLVDNLTPHGWFPQEAHAADLDGDGITDLVVRAANLGLQVALSYRGLGGGEFGPAVAHTIGFSAGDIDVADVTGDGVPDLLGASDLGLGVRPGLGDGTFGSALLVDGGAWTDGLSTADFDGDGQLDLSAWSGSQEVVFWRGDGTGAFVQALRVTGVSSQPRAFIPADLTGNGMPDLIRPTSFDSFLGNRTYGSGAPFLDLGAALADPGGEPGNDPFVDQPILLAEGTMLPTDTLTLRIYRNGVQVTQVWLIAGTSAALTPFRGGTLVPAPDVVLGPFGVQVVPELVLAGALPAGTPSGFTLWAQAWFLASPSQPWKDNSSTSAVRATTP